MSIYSPQICFVYKWTQLSTGKWYIGSRTAKNCNPEDGYICSSKIVKPMIKANPEDWTRIILETGSKDDILLLEHELLKCLNAAQSEYSYNLNNSSGTFSTAGKPLSHNHKINLSIALTGISRKQKPRLTLEHKNKIAIKRTGKQHSLETLNKMSISNKGKSQHILICPHCTKIGGNAMKRWHFDNCKFKLL